MKLSYSIFLLKASDRMAPSRLPRNKLAAAKVPSAYAEELRRSRARIGEMLNRRQKENECFLEAMFYTLSAEKQVAFCAGQTDPTLRWKEALRFRPTECDASGFQAKHVRDYLRFLERNSFIKGFTFKKAKRKGKICQFTLGRITEGMVNHPEKYPHGIILLGAAPKSDKKPKLKADLVNATKDFCKGRKRKMWRPYSELRIRKQKIQLYQFLKLPHGDSLTHACSVANTLDKAGCPKIGLYDNGRPRVTEFTIEEFRTSLMRFWDAFFFDIDI